MDEFKFKTISHYEPDQFDKLLAEHINDPSVSIEEKIMHHTTVLMPEDLGQYQTVLQGNQPQQPTTFPGNQQQQMNLRMVPITIFNCTLVYKEVQ